MSDGGGRHIGRQIRHQAGEVTPFYWIWDPERENPCVGTWCPRPPGQTRMRYDGASKTGSDLASKR